MCVLFGWCVCGVSNSSRVIGRNTKSCILLCNQSGHQYPRAHPPSPTVTRFVCCSYHANDITDVFVPQTWIPLTTCIVVHGWLVYVCIVRQWCNIVWKIGMISCQLGVCLCCSLSLTKKQVSLRNGKTNYNQKKTSWSKTVILMTMNIFR